MTKCKSALGHWLLTNHSGNIFWLKLRRLLIPLFLGAVY